MSMAASENVKVHHILADGRKVDSIDGYVVPNGGETAAVYQLIADLIQKKKEDKLNETA